MSCYFQKPLVVWAILGELIPPSSTVDGNQLWFVLESILKDFREARLALRYPGAIVAQDYVLCIAEKLGNVAHGDAGFLQ